MAFTLRLTFSGLCLFVPEPVGGGSRGRSRVLVAGMFKPHHGRRDRHGPVIAYDTGYLTPGGLLLGVPALAKLTGHTFVPVAGGGAGLWACGQDGGRRGGGRPRGWRRGGGVDARADRGPARGRRPVGGPRPSGRRQAAEAGVAS